MIEIIIQVVVAFVASASFAVIFHSPKNQICFGGIVGAIGWLVYILLHSNGMNEIISSFFATIALAVIARYFSYIRKAPVSVFLITGIFALVPGAGIYSTGYSLFMGSTQEAMAIGINTLQIAIAIALGMGITLSLPSCLFSLKKGRENEKNNFNS